MLKTVVSMTVALMISSVACGDIVLNGATNQLQNTTLGLCNTLTLLQGNQAADAIQNLAVSNDQTANTTVGQSLLGNIAEIGHASGDCAIVGVGQALTAAGMQAQAVGNCCDPKAQGQTLTLAAENELLKSEGPGAGDALHQIVLQAGQGAANSAGAMQGCSSILGLQSSTLNGVACATGQMASEMAVSTVQTQSTN